MVIQERWLISQILEKKNTKKRILLVGAFPSSETKIFGGIVTSCSILLNSSFSKKYILNLIDSTQISNPPPSIAIRSILASKRFLKYTYRLFREDIDVVLLFISGNKTSFLEKGIMAWLARIKSKPVIIFPRGGQIIEEVQSSRIHKFWIKKMLQGGNHYICQGPTWKYFFNEELKFNENQTTIVYNWTASESLLSIGEKKRYSEQNDRIRILFLGWLEESKGIFELLEVIMRLSRDYNFRMVIAGRGHAEVDARAFVDQNGLKNVVDFIGWIEGEEKQTILAGTDILVLPSWHEGFPNVIIEAMAAKVAVVATKVGNIPSILTDGNQALLVPSQNVDFLLKAVERLINDSTFRFQLSERGYFFARDNFRVEPAVKKLSKVIESLV